MKLLHHNMHLISKRTFVLLLLSLLVQLMLSIYFYTKLSDLYFLHLESNLNLITSDSIAKSDTTPLVDILNKTRTSYNWICIKGQKGSITFFEQKNDVCETNFFRRKIQVENHNNSEIKLEAILQMPESTNHLIFGVVLFLATITCFSIITLSRGLEKDHVSKLTLERIESEKVKYEAKIQFKLARQVAHDIRSPLSALDMIVSSSEKLPSEERRIVKHAVRRIHDIANNLLNKSKPDFNMTEPRLALLAPVIESLISEKRIQYRTSMHTVIDFKLTEKSIGIFVDINESDLKRVLSNLINNSAEALKNGDGKIALNLSSTNDTAQIEIVDNGHGISEHILKSLSSSTPQSSKSEGNAIGLKSAKEIIQNYGGSLDIHTKMGQGTTITIKLPLTSTPRWYQAGLTINSNEVVIVDDDKTIHQLWAQKLNQTNFRGKINHYTNFEHEINPNVQYLIDYEFLDQGYNGLDKIVELKIPNAILVTSHYDEELIQRKCIEHGIKIIPKSAIPYISITLNNHLDLILLDDDELIRLSWDHSAQKQNRKIACYSKSADLMNEINNISKSTPIYLDSELGEEKKGQDIALELFKMGYTNLILCTGHSPDQFKDMHWLTKIQGKNYPV